MMKCNKCGNEISIKLGAKIMTKGCKVLTAMTTVLTVQCEKCSAFFQVPVQGNSFFSVNEKKAEQN